MVFISNAEGTIIKTVPSPIYQGSNDANEIVLISPFLGAAHLLCTASNGTKLKPIPMTALFECKYDQGFNMNVYQTHIPSSISQYPGTIKIQFEITITENGKERVIPTSATSLIVYDGVNYISESSDTDQDLDANPNLATATAEAVKAANASRTYRGQARGWAIGTYTDENGTEKENESYKENNAKYFSNQAKNYAESIQNSSETISKNTNSINELHDLIGAGLSGISLGYVNDKLILYYTTIEGEKAKVCEIDFLLQHLITDIEERHNDKGELELGFVFRSSASTKWFTIDKVFNFENYLSNSQLADAEEILTDALNKILEIQTQYIGGRGYSTSY